MIPKRASGVNRLVKPSNDSVNCHNVASYICLACTHVPLEASNMHVLYTDCKYIYRILYVRIRVHMGIQALCL